jgi:4-hydroxybenzoyl-CoA thioesterase
MRPSTSLACERQPRSMQPPSERKLPDVTTYSNRRTVRIEWGDCDPAGIIFYPRYFEIFDASTAALFERALGMTKFDQLKHFNFAGYPLVRTRAKFIRPTRFGDDVIVESTITFGRSSFNVEHRLSRNGELCSECTETRVWVIRDPLTGDIKSHPVPEEVLSKFMRKASA